MSNYPDGITTSMIPGWRPEDDEDDEDFEDDRDFDPDYADDFDDEPDFPELDEFYGD